MARHRIKFKYAGPEDDVAVDMAFSKKKIEERKVCIRVVFLYYFVTSGLVD